MVGVEEKIRIFKAPKLLENIFSILIRLKKLKKNFALNFVTIAIVLKEMKSGATL